MTTWTCDVLDEVYSERQRQDAKWDEQNHPDGTGDGALPYFCRFYESAKDAMDVCQSSAERGNCTYAHILWKEVAEAFEESDPARLRAELVQVAAVAVAWVEKIDRDARRVNP